MGLTVAVLAVGLLMKMNITYCVIATYLPTKSIPAIPIDVERFGYLRRFRSLASVEKSSVENCTRQPAASPTLFAYALNGTGVKSEDPLRSKCCLLLHSARELPAYSSTSCAKGDRRADTNPNPWYDMKGKMRKTSLLDWLAREQLFDHR
jgi:hypothetical protein